MVQIVPHSPYSQDGGATYQSDERRTAGRHEGKPMSREEHAQRMRDLNIKRGLARAPRRGWSMTDHQAENILLQLQSSQLPTPQVAAIPENEPLPALQEASPSSPTSSASPITPTTETIAELPRRPKMPAPRRSYSVMDYEPLPHNLPRPSERLGLLDLPSELHYALFDFLDPIDGVCLGLAHSKLYGIHRRKNGKVPLSSRYSGPNDMEWAWRGAGPLVGRAAPRPEAAKEKDLEQLRVKGQVYCRKCGVSRCELHRHLKDWIGAGHEYCEIKQVYGQPAGEDAKTYCFMSSPKNPHRCGRHGSMKVAAA